MRSRGAIRLQTRDLTVRLAAATAKSMSADVPALTSHSGVPVAGLMTVNRPFATESTNFPSMKWPVSYFSFAARACQSLVLKEARLIDSSPFDNRGGATL